MKPTRLTPLLSAGKSALKRGSGRGYVEPVTLDDGAVVTINSIEIDPEFDGGSGSRRTLSIFESRIRPERT